MRRPSFIGGLIAAQVAAELMQPGLYGDGRGGCSNPEAIGRGTAGGPGRTFVHAHYGLEYDQPTGAAAGNHSNYSPVERLLYVPAMTKEARAKRKRLKKLANKSRQRNRK